MLVLQDEYKILGRFAGDPAILEYRKINQKKYSRNLKQVFDESYKMYITTDYKIVITNYKLDKNDIIYTHDFSRQELVLKNIQYWRLSKPHRNKGFIHYFTGKEHLYIKTLDKYYKNMIYIICSNRVLAKKIENKSKPFKIF